MSNLKNYKKAIDKFFKQKKSTGKTKKTKTEKSDELKIYYRSLTLGNLCVALEMTREQFLDLKDGDDKEVSLLLQFTMQRIEAKIEEGILFGYISNTAGMFILKNSFGYVDRKEQEIKVFQQKTHEEQIAEFEREHALIERVDKFLDKLGIVKIEKNSL